MKMLKFPNYQGNANQNHEIYPYTCQNGYYQKDNKNKLQEVMEKRKPSYTCERKPQYTFDRNIISETSSKSENRATVSYSNSTSDIYQKKIKTLIQNIYMHLHVHCNIIYSSQNMETSKCLSVDEWMNSTYIQWNVIQPQKRRLPWRRRQ